MVLFGIFGELGSGKTLLLTYLLFKKWILEGQKIYANYHLFKMPYMYVGSVKTFDTIRSGCFGGDELWLVVDSRSHKSAKIIITNILSRSRKRNLTIYYTTQLLGNIDNRIRKITDFTALCALNPKETIAKVSIFRGSKLTPGAYMKTLYFPTDVVFSLYETNEEVVPWEEDPEVSNAPEDGKWIFQESKDAEMTFFEEWEKADEYAREYWKRRKVLI